MKNKIYVQCLQKSSHDKLLKCTAQPLQYGVVPILQWSIFMCDSCSLYTSLGRTILVWLKVLPKQLELFLEILFFSHQTFTRV